MTRRTTTESEPHFRLSRQGEDNGAYVALPEDNHSFLADSLALTLYRPSQHNNLGLEQLTTEQGPQDVFPEYHLNVLEEMKEENIRLRLQRDDLLTQRIALENDLSTSFMHKFDLESQLSSANRTIDKGRAYYETLEDEWKRDHAKLQDMIRIFEANTENERHVEILRQQNLLEEENSWLFGQLQMKTEDNRLFACQREAVVQASSYDRACAMTSEIEMLRQQLSTVQAQLADSHKAKQRLAEELHQERLKHQATRNAFDLKTKTGSSPYNVQQTAYPGGSAPQKPSKFTSAYPTAFQTPLPKAEIPPPFSTEQKSESIFGADPLFDPYPASSNITQQYGTRSKSKFSFGDNTVPKSASTATGTTNGATSRTDFNFTFKGTTDHHSSLGADGDTTELGLPKDLTCPANIAVGSSVTPLVEAENPQSLDKHDHGKDGENKGHVQAPKLANRYINLKTRKGARKPLASDFFDEEPVEAEVKTNSKDAAAIEKTIKESAPIVSAGADVSQKVHIGGYADHSATAESSVQAGEGNEIKEAEQGKIPLSPPATLSSSPVATKGAPKQSKNKGKTSKRAFLRKVAKERKRAAIGEANWSETS